MSSASLLSAAASERQPSAISEARLSRLFAEQHALVWRVLRRLGLSHEAAAEATRDVFERCPARIAACEMGAERVELLALAFSVLEVMDCHGRARTPGERRAEPGRSGVVHAAPVRASSAPAELMDRALLRMTRTSARMFVLFEIEGLSLSDAARASSVEEGDALGILERARAEFRAIARDLLETARSR